MKVVFYGSLIHHLADTLLAKVKAPWTASRFLESDAREDLARALVEADVLISLVWNGSFRRAEGKAHPRRDAGCVVRLPAP
jgi:hypothetical protein